MLSDIARIESYHSPNNCDNAKVRSSWNRIKTALVELGKSPNKQSTPLCDGCQRNADNSCKVDVKCVYFIPME